MNGRAHDTEPRGAAFWIGLIVGLAIMVFGVVGAVSNRGATQPLESAKWLVGADLIHPSPQGARIVAQLLTGQLLIGYERYMQNHPGPQQKLPAPVISETSTQPSKAAKPMGVQ